VPATREPIHGRDKVLRLLSGLGRLYAGVETQQVHLASGEGLVSRLADAVIGVTGVEISHGRITELNLVVNPAKLQRIQAPPQ
jgi:RNA polymerase sigma-70 factor (ECF subfamily)